MKKLLCLAALLCISFAGCSPAATEKDKEATKSAGGGAVGAMKEAVPASDGAPAGDGAAKDGAAAPSEAPSEAPKDGAAAPVEAPKDAVDAPK